MATEPTVSVDDLEPRPAPTAAEVRAMAEEGIARTRDAFAALALLRRIVNDPRVDCTFGPAFGHDTEVLLLDDEPWMPLTPVERRLFVSLVEPLTAEQEAAFVASLGPQEGTP